MTHRMTELVARIIDPDANWDRQETDSTKLQQDRRIATERACEIITILKVRCCTNPRPLTDLEDDAYELGGPMSGRPRPDHICRD